MHTQHDIAVIKGHAMHALIALSEPARSFAGGIQFAMMDGPSRVICWVSREALDRIKGHDPCLQDAMACFERHRLRIEHLARQKYEAGERSPIVLSFDFETLR